MICLMFGFVIPILEGKALSSLCLLCCLINVLTFYLHCLLITLSLCPILISILLYAFLIVLLHGLILLFIFIVMAMPKSTWYIWSILSHLYNLWEDSITNLHNVILFLYDVFGFNLILLLKCYHFLFYLKFILLIRDYVFLLYFISI